MKRKKKIIMKHPETKDNRRHLRHHGTPAEATLWTMLKNKQASGLRFRRQHAVGPYILDFYCPAIGLAIELDGQPHFTSEGQEYDDRRTRYINAVTGIHILRFENRVVFEYPEMILAAIHEFASNSNKHNTQES